MASEISFNDTKPGDLPGTDKLYRISIYPAMDNGTTADFEYDGNKITKMTIRRVDSGMGSFDELSVDAVYDYSYNEDGELVKVVYTDENNDTRDYITDVIYESGNIRSTGWNTPRPIWRRTELLFELIIRMLICQVRLTDLPQERIYNLILCL